MKKNINKFIPKNDEYLFIKIHYKSFLYLGSNLFGIKI